MDTPIANPSANHSTPEPDARQTKSLRGCLIRLWQVMTDRYGHKWTSVYGISWDENEQPWMNDLHDLTPQEFAEGVRRDLERDSGWPPGSKEFRFMATKERRSREPAHQLVERDKRLGRDRDTSKGLAAIEKAKLMLATGEVPPEHAAALNALRGEFERRFPHSEMARGDR